MKRIPILFVFVAAMSLFSCSKGDDSTPKLELKETNYNLIVNEEVQLELVNTDIDISDWTQGICASCWNDSINN